MRKHAFALVFAAVGLVLTFLLTVGKFIGGGTLLLRYAVNVAVFFGVGLGLEYLYRKFLLPMARQEEESRNGLSDILSTGRPREAGKGDRLDLTVEGPVDASGVPGGSGVAGTGTAGTGASGEAGAGGPAGETRPNPAGPHTDFEIRDDFIIINDKKMKNDPKLMASAIKTKLGE